MPVGSPPLVSQRNQLLRLGLCRSERQVAKSPTSPAVAYSSTKCPSPMSMAMPNAANALSSALRIHNASGTQKTGVGRDDACVMNEFRSFRALAQRLLLTRQTHGQTRCVMDQLFPL